MAGSEITIRAELRTCIVKGRKALFHKWSDKSSIVEPSPMVGRHKGGVVKYTTAIIEYEDGIVTECYPYEVKFVDKKTDDYNFGDVKNE